MSEAAGVTAEASILTVKAGGDLQAAINAAKPGDEIVLDAGAVFKATFTLPMKADGPPIVIRSSAVLPNRRISPADVALLASIGSTNVEPAIMGHNTANWKFDGIRFLPTHDGLYNVVWLENARNVTFDRILFVGEASGQRRVILGNGQQITVTRSHFENVFRQGDESNAFCAYNGGGPYTITDNYFEVAGINILFGGANSDSPAHVPADILVQGNHLTKRWEWKPDGAKPATVKNLFEIKSGKRAVIRGNLMERNWTNAQNGFGVLFTVSNDGEAATWTTIEDILFENNILRDTERGININGTGYGAASTLQLRRLTIRNNLLGAGFQIGGEAGEVTFDHNTFTHQGGLGLLYRGGIWRTGEAPREGRFAVEKFTFTNNLAYHGDGGLVGDGVGSGLAALTEHTASYTWTHNVLANRIGTATYPSVTWHPTTAEHQAQFNADSTLKTGSTYRKAANDGTDLGWNATASYPTTFLTTPTNLRIIR